MPDVVRVGPRPEQYRQQVKVSEHRFKKFNVCLFDLTNAMERQRPIEIVDGLANIIRAVLFIPVIMREGFFQLISENIKRSDQVAFSCAVFNVAILLLFIRQRPSKSRGAIAEFLCTSDNGRRSLLTVTGQERNCESRRLSEHPGQHSNVFRCGAQFLFHVRRCPLHGGATSACRSPR